MRTFSDGLTFICTHCGNCCSSVGNGISLHSEDKSRLGERLLGRTVPVYHPVFSSKIQTNEGVCSFFEAEKGECSVYALRPSMCSLYPFYLGINRKGELLLCVEHCPGVDEGNGDQITDEYIEKKIQPILDSAFGDSYVRTLQSLVQKNKPPFIKLLSAHSLFCSWAGHEAFLNRVLDNLSDSTVAPSALLFSYFKRFRQDVRSLGIESSEFISTDELEKIGWNTVSSTRMQRSNLAFQGRDLEIRYLRELLLREGTHRGLYSGTMSIDEELAFLQIMAALVEGGNDLSSKRIQSKVIGVAESIQFADGKSFDVACAVLKEPSPQLDVCSDGTEWRNESHL